MASNSDVRACALSLRWFTGAALLLGNAALLAMLLCAALPCTAHAYSAFDDYMRSIEEGGGGGKLFTGTPADGYTCDVCHRGGVRAPLSVIGLPEAGYVPGLNYEIVLSAPESVPRVAIMAELTDPRGAPAGTTALLPFATWLPSEKCEDGVFPATDVCRAGGDQSGCCLDVKPGTDSCSFPGERSVVWMAECGAHTARLLWTAPAQPVDVWFSASLLSSNAGNNVDGDGVTLFRRRLHPAGSSELRTEALGSCQVGHVSGARFGPSLLLWMAAVVVRLARRGRARKRLVPTAKICRPLSTASAKAAPVPLSLLQITLASSAQVFAEMPTPTRSRTGRGTRTGSSLPI